MSDLGKLDWELIMRGAQAMQPRWVANGNQAAGTSLSVRYANPESLVPLVGASDQKNFIGARIVFGPGAGDTPSANMGFSTTISAMASSVTDGVTTTTLTLADAIPNTIHNGDQCDIYAAQEITVTAPENIAEVGGTAVPTVNGIPSLPTVGEGSISEGVPGDAAPAQAQQVAGTDGSDLRALLTDTDGTTHDNITKVAGIAVPTDFAGNPVLPTTQFDQLVQNGTIGSTQTGFVASGDEVAYDTLTINGTYRVNGAAYLNNLTLADGATLILGDGATITLEAFS